VSSAKAHVNRADWNQGEQGHAGRKEREKEREEWAGQRLSAQKSFREKLKFKHFLGLNQILNQFEFEQILLEL
jgi:hypothetical protein